MARYYSSTAGEMILQGGITSGDTVIVVDTTAGLPTSYPYTLLLDADLSTEEIVDVVSAATTTLTIERGKDGSVAQAHAYGAKIRHAMTARDLRESRDHEAATEAHGATGAVVGTTNTQTLDNKTVEPSADHVALTLRARAANTEPLLEVQTSASTAVAELHENDLRFTDGTNTLARIYHGTLAAFYKRILSLRVSGDINTITGDISGSPTGRFIRLLSGSTELFTVAANGDVAANNITTGAWASYTPSWSGLAINNGTVSAQKAVIGKTTIVRMKVTMGSTSSFSSTFKFTLPSGFITGQLDNAIGTAVMYDSSGAVRNTAAVVTTGTNEVFFQAGSSAVAPTVPWTWAVGDTLSFTATYESA